MLFLILFVICCCLRLMLYVPYCRLTISSTSLPPHVSIGRHAISNCSPTYVLRRHQTSYTYILRDVTSVPLHNWLAHVTTGCADHLDSPPLHEHRGEPHDRSAAAGAGESAGGRGGQVACAPPAAVGSLIGGAGRKRASLSGRQR